MRRIRHLGRLIRDVGAFSGGVGAVWMIPLLVIILAVAITVVSVNTGLPYVVYTLL